MYRPGEARCNHCPPAERMKGNLLARLLQKGREQSIARKPDARPKAKAKAKAKTKSIPAAVEKVKKVSEVSRDKMTKTGQLYRIPRDGIQRERAGPESACTGLGPTARSALSLSRRTLATRVCCSSRRRSTVR